MALDLRIHTRSRIRDRDTNSRLSSSGVSLFRDSQANASSCCDHGLYGIADQIGEDLPNFVLINGQQVGVAIVGVKRNPKVRMP